MRWLVALLMFAARREHIDKVIEPALAAGRWVLCDRFYEVAGRALHERAERFYDREVALGLLAEIGAPAAAWDDALADPTTHDDVRADHDAAVLGHVDKRHCRVVIPVLVAVVDLVLDRLNLDIRLFHLAAVELHLVERTVGIAGSYGA